MRSTPASDQAGCADRRIAALRRSRGYERDNRGHRDPRGAPRPQLVLDTRRDEKPDGFGSTISAWSKSTSTADHGPPRVRRRRLRRRHRGARCPIPRRRGRRPRTRVVGHCGGHAALNRRELPPTTPDCVSIDHRRGAAFAPGELVEYFRAGFDLDQDIRTYVEVVHRLGELGAVCTHVGHGVSRDGFDAEWRGIDLLTVDSNMVNRCEVFDEADLDTAIARFEELRRPTPRLENAASQAFQRVESYFAARDWDAWPK